LYDKLGSDWTAVLVVVVSNCSPNPAPKDCGTLSFVPKDDETASAVPAPKDDDMVSFVPEDTGIWGAEGNGIEKLIVGCLICELLALAVD